MRRLFIALTFESLDEILFCYHTKMKPPLMSFYSGVKKKPSRDDQTG